MVHAEKQNKELFCVIMGWISNPTFHRQERMITYNPEPNEYEWEP